MQDIHPYLDALASLAHPEGGWGYAPDQPVHLEPTAFGVLALSLEPERHAGVLASAKQALERQRREDGTYRLSRGREEAVWPTALVLFVRSALNEAKEPTQQSAAALLSIRGKRPEQNKEKDNDVHDINLDLIGWPWADGNFSWAEPTAWASLALRHAGHGDHARVEEGLRLLLDRTADEGGINYGNRMVLGRKTEPMPGPTAAMLLALQGHGDHPRVESSVKYLLEQVLASDDLEHLCLAKLALSLHGDQPGLADKLPLLDARIREAYLGRKETSWVRPAPLRQALTALALASERKHFFRVPDDAATRRNGHAPAAVTLSKKRLSLGDRFRAAVQGLAVKAAGSLRQLPPQSQVHIARAENYDADLSGVLKRQFETFRAQVQLKGKRVVLKPNLVEYHRDKVINTNPKVVAAVIELCRSEGAAEVIVAEGPGHHRNVEYLVQASGLGDVLRHYNVPFIDLNHDEPVKRPNLGRLTGLEYLYLSRTVATADVLISLPKLKTHHWAGATLSLKNLFGTLPGICYGWPKNELHWRGIDNSIVDIALTRTPELAIVDGIVGMEGDGPLNGTPKQMGVLVMGTDLLAVDATSCRLMELDPERIAYLGLGAMKKLGHLHTKEIQQVGETIESLAQPFETVPHFKELRLCKSA